MSELTEKLLKVASTIDSLIEKITKEEEIVPEVTKEASNKDKNNNGFGTLSNSTAKGSNPLLDFILS